MNGMEGRFLLCQVRKRKNTYQSVNSVKTDCVWGESVKRNASYIMYFFDASPVQLEKPTNFTSCVWGNSRLPGERKRGL